MMGSKNPPCLTPTRSGEQAGQFASLGSLQVAGLGQGRPAAPPPSHHVTSKGRQGFGMRRPQRRPRRGRQSCGGGREGRGRGRTRGWEDWRGGGGAQEGAFSSPSARAGGARQGGRRFGFVQETCKYGPRNSICSCRFPI